MEVSPQIASLLTTLSLATLTPLSPPPTLHPSPAPLIAQTRSAQRLTFTGKLDASSQQGKQGEYYNEHQFSGTAGQAISLEMVTQEFTPYVTLLDPQGRVLAIRNGQGGGKAQIGQSLPVTGTYTIVASSASAGETGSYQIQLQLLTPERATSSQASSDGDRSVVAVTPRQFTGVLDPNVSILDGIPHYGKHTFQGMAGQAIAIEMTSRDFDVYLILRDAQGNSLDQDDNGLTGTDARIVMRLPTTGIYTIEATTLGQKLGEYTIQVRAANDRELRLIVAEQLDRQAMQRFQQRDYPEALRLLEQQVQILEQVLGCCAPNIRYALRNLASVHEALGNHAEAEALHQRSIKIAEQVPGEGHVQAMVMELEGLVSFYRRRGNAQEAERLTQRIAQLKAQQPHNQAARLPSSTVNPALTPIQQAEAIDRQSQQLAQQGRDSEALLLIKQVLQSLQETLDANPPDADLVSNTLEPYRRFTGGDDRAEALYLQALQIQERILGKQAPAVAATLNNLASLYRRQGNLAKAEPLYQRSRQIREQVLGKDHLDVAATLNNLALLYRAQKRYAQAEALYQQSLTIYQQHLKPAHLSIATTMSNLALLYVAQENYTLAQPLFGQVLQIQEQVLGQAIEVAKTLNHLAEVYRRQGNFAQAEPLFWRSLQIQEDALRTQEQTLDQTTQAQFANTSVQLADSLSNLASLYESQRSYTKADALYRRALRVLERILGTDHPDVTALLNKLALLSKVQGDAAQAEFLYLQALENLRQQSVNREADPRIANTLNNLTTLYLTQGNPAQLAILRRAIDEAVSNHLQRQVTNENAANEALQAILRHKGYVVETITQAVQSLQNLSPQEQAKLQELRAKQTQLAALLYAQPGDSLAVPPRDICPATIDRTQVTALRAEIEALETTLAQRTARQHVELTTSIREIANRIDDNTVLIEWIRYHPFNPVAASDQLWGKPRYAAYLLDSQGTIQWVELGEAAAIEELIQQTRVALQRRSFRLKDIARKLDAHVMQPIRRRLGRKRHLLLSPDGQLHLIPFAALVDERNQYLAETYTLTYLTTGRDLLRSSLNASPRQGAILIANPDYDNADTPHSTQIASTTPASRRSSSSTPHEPFVNLRSTDLAALRFEPLPGTEQEAQNLQPLLADVTLLTGTKATENYLKQLRGPRILHVATHGFFFQDMEFVPPQTSESAAAASLTTVAQTEANPMTRDRSVNTENPLLRSGLALAGFNVRRSGAEDGVLTALEAAGLDLRGTQLVVLSACDTGLGDVVNGEGVYGLRRALVMAGAQSQLISLWKVDDFATSELMTRYYRRLRQGEGRSEAFRQVQLELLQTPEYQHPYYWAAFIFSGDWQPLVTPDNVLFKQRR